MNILLDFLYGCGFALFIMGTIHLICIFVAFLLNTNGWIFALVGLVLFGGYLGVCRRSFTQK